MKITKTDIILLHKLLKVHERKISNGSRAVNADEHERTRRLLKMFGERVDEE